jgi:hypothetical protein
VEQNTLQQSRMCHTGLAVVWQLHFKPVGQDHVAEKISAGWKAG